VPRVCRNGILLNHTRGTLGYWFRPESYNRLCHLWAANVTVDMAYYLGGFRGHSGSHFVRNCGEIAWLLLLCHRVVTRSVRYCTCHVFLVLDIMFFFADMFLIVL
jgi:hypothetical protein